MSELLERQSEIHQEISDTLACIARYGVNGEVQGIMLATAERQAVALEHIAEGLWTDECPPPLERIVAISARIFLTLERIAVAMEKIQNNGIHVEAGK